MIDRVVVINDFSAVVGGASSLALDSADGFRDLGLPVTYVTGDKGNNQRLLDRGVEVVALGQAALLQSSARKVFFTGLYNRRAEAMVQAWIARFDTPGTVYHLHNWSQIFSPSIFRALQPVSARLVHTAHDFFLVCPNGAYAWLKTGQPCPLTPLSAGCLKVNCDRSHYANKLWRSARQAVRAAVFDVRRRRPRILAIHEGMRPYLTRAGVPDDIIHVVPNPVRPYVDAQVAVEGNQEAIFVGRLEPGKGPDLACAAARRAGVRLRLIGDGPLRPELEARYPEHGFFGRLPLEAIREHAAKARMLLMPSRYPEPYGLVAAEALWSGIPVIAADTAFLATDILAAGAGLACDPRDEKAFADAIGLIARDDGAARRMSEAAMANTGGIGLTRDAWLAAHMDHYRAVLAARASTAAAA